MNEMTGAEVWSIRRLFIPKGLASNVKDKCPETLFCTCTYNAASGAHAAQRLWRHSLRWLLGGVSVLAVEAAQATLTAELLKTVIPSWRQNGVLRSANKPDRQRIASLTKLNKR